MMETTLVCPQCAAWPMPRPDCPRCAGTGQVCPRCQGIGYVVRRSGVQRASLTSCSCTAAHRRSARRPDSLQGHWQSCSFATFNAPARPGAGPAFNAAVLQTRAIHDSYCAQGPLERPLLVLVGPVGCGKTHLAAALVNWCINHGLAAAFWTAPDLFDHLREGFEDPQGDSAPTRLLAVRTVPVLAVVDIGVLRFSAWAEEKLYQILSARTAEHLATVITCHRDLDELPTAVAAQLRHPALSQVVSIAPGDDAGEEARCV